MTDAAPRDREATRGESKLGDSLIEAWRQSMVEQLPVIALGEQTVRVGQTGNLGLRTVALRVGSTVIEGIEQNPNTSSRWAKLAQQGQKIMQFRSQGRYIGNVCDGRLTRYPSWKAQGLPD